MRRLTLLIFGVTVLAWVFSQPLSRLLGNLDQFDSLVAMVAIVAVGVSGVASWPRYERQTEWGVLLLFGGGLCLSAVLQVSGTSAFLAQQMVSLFGGAPSWLVVLVIATFVVTDGVGIEYRNGGLDGSAVCTHRQQPGAFPRGDIGDGGSGCLLCLHVAGGDAPQRHGFCHRPGPAAADDAGRFGAQYLLFAGV